MKKVMVFGVFDLLHPGHIDFLQQAKRHGDYLIVSVARDKNVKKIKDKTPFRNENERVEMIKTLKIADKIILGGVYDPWPHIKREKPDLIALGYDQGIYVRVQGAGDRDQLKQPEQELREHGLKKTKVKRMKPFKPEVFKTSKIRNAKAL